MNRLSIIGAGPVGTLLALTLAKKGYQIEIFEKRHDPTVQSKTEGRSINLALSMRGIHALKQAGLDQAVFKNSVRMKGRMVHLKEKETHFIPYSPHQSDTITSISRFELTKLLLEEAKKAPNIAVRFHEECLGIDPYKQEMFFKNTLTNKDHHRPFSLLFDSEGTGSAVRTSLLKLHYTNFTQEYLNYEYKELTIPALNGQCQLQNEAFHLWPRGKFLMIALPNPDKSFTCTLFLPRGDFSKLDTPQKVCHFFQNEFPGTYSLFSDANFFQRPIGVLLTIKMFPWAFLGKVLLIGDAAHGIVPFYGQGLNCGFEDVTFLNECLDRHPNHWERVFKDYEEGRKINTDAIAELSFDNFIELREKAADPLFRLKRELERRLEEAYPNQFMSKYSMVTFSLLPYEEALIRGRRQDQFLMDVCANIKSVDELNLESIKNMLEKYHG